MKEPIYILVNVQEMHDYVLSLDKTSNQKEKQYQKTKKMSDAFDSTSAGGEAIGAAKLANYILSKSRVAEKVK